MLLLAPDVYLRNIPAYAGPTVAMRGFNELSKEHPRACGADLYPIAPTDSIQEHPRGCGGIFSQSLSGISYHTNMTNMVTP